MLSPNNMEFPHEEIDLHAENYFVFGQSDVHEFIKKKKN